MCLARSASTMVAMSEESAESGDEKAWRWGIAFLIAFVTSFEELTIAMFVTGGLSATLPKQLWADMLMAVSPSLAAVSTLMLAVVTVIVVIAQIVRGRARP